MQEHLPYPFYKFKTLKILDWDKLKNNLRKNIIRKINKNFNVNIENHIVEEKVFTPKEISINTNSYLGSLYGESSNSIFSPLKRHQNFSRKIKNLLWRHCPSWRWNSFVYNVI